MDKTPACAGGGFGFFKDTEHGRALYESTLSRLSDFDVDTWWDRFQSLLNQWLHLMLAKNYFFILNVIGYVLSAVKREELKWSALQLSVRRNKTIAPFQHRSSIYLRKPSIYQLLSIRYALDKDYEGFKSQEITRRDLFLQCIPSEYHAILFPWMTKELLDRMRENEGISEFLWVFTPNGDRQSMLDHLDETMWIPMINTTWVHNEASVLEGNVGQTICDMLVYLPNLCELDNRMIVKLANDLISYCKKHKVLDHGDHHSNGCNGHVANGANGHIANGHVANGDTANEFKS